MRLVEFKAPNMLTRDVVSALGSIFKLERVGGESRVYQVAESGLQGVIFMVNGGPKAIGVASDGTNVRAVYVWNEYAFDQAPDIAIDIPADATLQGCIESLARLIDAGRTGVNENLVEAEKKVVSAAEFKKMAQEMLGAAASRVDLPTMVKVADANGVGIPGSIRQNQKLKVGPNHWNLATDEQINRELEKAVDGNLGEPDRGDADVAALKSQTKALKNMSATGRLVLLARNAAGAYFKLPANLDNLLDKLERLAVRELAADSEHDSMEEQYEYLTEQVKLIAAGESQFVKSMLITGAPSSGKTYTVMKAIHELGFTEGKDYVVKKGGMTASVLLRTLIAQIDGLIIFDDCDDVVAEERARNMLKGALDTDPIRPVSDDKATAIMTDTMSFDDRKEFVDAVSRVLRNEATDADVERFRRYLKPKKSAKTKDEPVPDDEDEIEAYLRQIGARRADPDPEDEGAVSASNKEELEQLQQFFSRFLPNRIDFRGRIIFISNHEKDWWDDAIVTRAFTIEMSFGDVEMFDFIRRIKHTIKHPKLSEAQKDEVLDYIWELYEAGILQKPINFRLIMSAFDLRLTKNWKKNIERSAK